jgi:hypothetical protein
VAARRLVVVMLVLLAISTLAAALIPPPSKQAPSTEESTGATTEPTQSAPSGGGKLVNARIDVGNAPAPTVVVERGDQLVLDVSAPFGDDIEIPAFGVTETVDPFAPAHFDLFANSRGTFPIRAVDARRVVGRIVVGPPGSGRCGVSTPLAPPGPATSRSCGPHDGRGSEAGGRSAQQP